MLSDVIAIVIGLASVRVSSIDYLPYLWGASALSHTVPAVLHVLLLGTHHMLSDFIAIAIGLASVRVSSIDYLSCLRGAPAISPAISLKCCPRFGWRLVFVGFNPDSSKPSHI